MSTLRTIEFGSCDYQAMVALRDKILRKPLGLTFSAVCRKAGMVREGQNRGLNPGCRLALSLTNLEMRISFSTPLKLSTTCHMHPASFLSMVPASKPLWAVMT